MFEIELKNPNEMTIKAKDRVVNINVAQSKVDANLEVGELQGAGEFELGDLIIIATNLKAGGTMYRVDVDGVKIGIVGDTAKMEDLDELGPVDVLGATDSKYVSVVEPKILIPMGNMDFSEIKASVNVDKKLKIKSPSALPAVLEIYKLD
jgi:hypothetical protein